MILSTFYFCWNLGALLTLAFRLLRRLPSSWTPWHKATSFLTFVVLIPILTLILVSLIAPVNALTAGVGLGLLLLADHFIPAATQEPSTQVDSKETLSAPTILGASLFTGVLVHWAMMTAFRGTGFAWDDMTYHAVSPAWWLQTSSLSVAPYTYQVYFPFNAELLAFFFMLPFQNDGQASLGVFLWGALAMTAAVTVAKQLGQHSGVAMTSIALFLIATPVWWLHHTFSSVDIAGAGWIMAAIAMAGAPAKSSRDYRVAALVSGLAIGGGIGTRIMSVLVFGLLTLWWAYRCWSQSSKQKKDWTPIAIFIGSAAIAGGYWYVRNWLLTGNPLFPAMVGPFAGPFDKIAQYDTTLLPFLAAGWKEPSFWWDLASKRWDWPYLLGAISVAGWCAAFTALRSDENRDKRFYLLLLGAIVLVIMVWFPTAPFSGTGNRPNKILHDFGRYLALPFLLGLTMVGTWFDRVKNGEQGAYALAVALLVALLTIPSWEPVLQVGGVALVVAFLLRSRSQAEIRHRLAPRVQHGVALATVLALALIQPVKQSYTDDKIYDFRMGGHKNAGKEKSKRDQKGKDPRTLRKTMKFLKKLPAGTEVGVYGYLPHDNRHFYPFFGRNFSMNVVPLGPDGKKIEPLHKRWKEARETWWSNFEDTEIHPVDFTANLYESSVDYVLISRCMGRFPFPEQADWMDQAKTFKLVHNDECFEVWDTREVLTDQDTQKVLSLHRPKAPPNYPTVDLEFEKNPDIILVSIDTLKASGLSVYGNPYNSSPFVDSLAQRGLRFTNMRSPAPWTLPAHTTMLTGQSPLTHGVIEDDRQVNPNTVMVSEVLKESGYQTGGFVATFYVSQKFGFGRGFDRYEDFSLHDAEVNLAGGVIAENVMDQAIDWASDLDEDKPFFMFLHVYDVHYEYDPPEPYTSMFDRAPLPTDTEYKSYKHFMTNLPDEEQLKHQQIQYAESMRYVDDQLLRVDTHLRSLGRDPVWVITSDHGEEFGERGSWGHAHSLYAEQLHIPLIISGPGLPQGRVLDTLVGTEDIAPTLAAWGKGRGKLDADGLDLSAVIDGHELEDRWMWAETSRSWSNRLSLIANNLRLEWTFDDDGSAELFDIKNDPLETKDLAKSKKKLVDKMKKDWMDKLGKPWTAHANGTVSVRRGVIVGGKNPSKKKVRKGEKFMVRPERSKVFFTPEGKKKERQGPWIALAGQAPEEGDPLSYELSDIGPVPVFVDEEVRAALEALGYLHNE
jgi:arylsulfatase A-like enzyme